MAVIQEATYRIGSHEITRKKQLEVGASEPLGKEKALDTGKLLGVRTQDNIDVFDKNSLFNPSSGRKNWTEWVQRLQKEEINEAGLKKSYLGGAVEKSYRWEQSEQSGDQPEEMESGCPQCAKSGHKHSGKEWDGVVTPPSRKPVREFLRGLQMDAQVNLIFLKRKAFKHLPESIRPKYMSGESISRTMVAFSYPEANDTQIRQAGTVMSESMEEEFTIESANRTGDKLREIFDKPKKDPTEK